MLKENFEKTALPPFLRDLDLVTALSSGLSDIDKNSGTFSAEVQIRRDHPAGIGVLLAPKPLSFYDRNLPVPTDPWSIFNLEPLRLVIRNGRAFVERGLLRPMTLLSDIPAEVSDGGFHRLACTYDTKTAVFFLDDKQIAKVGLPNYPSLCSVVTATDTKILVKIVNFSENADDVRITLDTDVLDEYRAERFWGEAHAKNTIDCPDTVRDEAIFLTGASREFVYHAPGMSVNVLQLCKNLKHDS